MATQSGSIINSRMSDWLGSMRLKHATQLAMQRQSWGAKATRRLRDIIREGHLDFIYVKCSIGTFACNYGRDCGTLKSNGRDVGAILIEEGLAVPFICGATHCPKTPRPWCPLQSN